MRKLSGLLEASAECRECGREWWARNAVGVAAQHAKRTGHEVHAEQTIVILFNPPPLPASHDEEDR